MTTNRRTLGSSVVMLMVATLGLNAPSAGAVPSIPRIDVSVPQKAVLLLDTRAGSQVGYAGGRPEAGTTLRIEAPVGAQAVALSIRGMNSDETGFVTAYPCSATRPTVSNLNLTPGRSSHNVAIVAVGVDRGVCIFTQRSADLAVELVAALDATDGYRPMEPVRVLDTRPETAIGFDGTRPSAGTTLRVAAPAGAAAVVLNVTGLDSAEEGFVTVFPCGEPIPTASNLNLTPGFITPNLAISKVGADGSVCIFTQRSAHIIADLAGSFASGSTYTALSPQRVIDTRPESWVGGYGTPGPGRIPSGTSVSFTAPAGSTAVAFNVTSVEGNLATVYAVPCPTIPLLGGVTVLWDQPSEPTMIRPAFAIAPVGSGGQVCLIVNIPGALNSTAASHLVVDLVGTFA